MTARLSAREQRDTPRATSEEMAAGLFLDPSGWAADGAYDPSKRGIWQAHNVCVYRALPGGETALVGLEEVRDMIDAEAVDASQLRLSGTLRPLGWRPGDPTAGPCNACVSMLGRYGPRALSRDHDSGHQRPRWCRHRGLPRRRGLAAGGLACLPRSQRPGRGGQLGGCGPLHPMLRAPPALIPSGEPPCRRTGWDARPLYPLARQQAWRPLGATLQRRLCLARDVVREIEEEDAADEDGPDEDAGAWEEGVQGVRAADALRLVARPSHSAAQSRKRASPVHTQPKAQQAAETWDSMSSRVRGVSAGGVAPASRSPPTPANPSSWLQSTAHRSWKPAPPASFS